MCLEGILTVNDLNRYKIVHHVESKILMKSLSESVLYVKAMRFSLRTPPIPYCEVSHKRIRSLQGLK